MTNEVKAKVVTIMQTVFDLPDLNPVDDLFYGEIPEWDSFNQVNLMITIESEFGIDFSPEEIGTLKSLNTIVQCILAK